MGRITADKSYHRKNILKGKKNLFKRLKEVFKEVFLIFLRLAAIQKKIVKKKDYQPKFIILFNFGKI